MDGGAVTTVVSALISAAVTLAVCLVTQRAQSIRDRTVLEMKLDELSRRVDRHNNLIERTFELERRTDVQEEKINAANHRIAALETKGEG